MIKHEKLVEACTISKYCHGSLRRNIRVRKDDFALMSETWQVVIESYLLSSPIVAHSRQTSPIIAASSLPIDLFLFSFLPAYHVIVLSIETV